MTVMPAVAMQNPPCDAITDAPITALPIRFEFSEKIPRYWFGGDAFLTHFMNAMSTLFPEGERFFVDAVRHFREQAKDARHQADIRGFIAQEAMHSREHHLFNALLASQGYPADQFEAHIGRLLAEVRKHTSAKHQLAITVALEHITAVMAEMILEHADIRERIDPAIRDLWIWHAVEETEHKAVAWDLYEAIGGSYGLRARVMLTATFWLFWDTAGFQHKLLKQDGLSGSPLLWAKGAWRLWGPRGYLSRLIPAWGRYFRRDFHPWQQDNAPIAAFWKRYLLEKLNRDI